MDALGVYIGLPPRGTMVIRLGAGPAVSPSGRHLIRRLLGPADWWAPLTGLVRSRQAASAAGGSCRLLITVAVLLMTRAWSWSHGNSPAAWRAITIATLRHIWLMARGPRGRSRPTLGGRLPTGPTGGALAIFWDPAGRWDPPPKGRTDKPSWAEDQVQ